MPIKVGDEGLYVPIIGDEDDSMSSSTELVRELMNASTVPMEDLISL